MLFLKLCIKVFRFSVILRRSSNDRFFSWIILMFPYLETSSEECLFYLILGFSFVKSNLESAFPCACTFHIVLFHFTLNNVFSIAYLFKSRLIIVFRQSVYIQVNDFILVVFLVRILVSFMA